MMNVTCSGSCFRFRTSFAARPTATRSRERRSAIASSSVIRSPEAAFSSTSRNGCALGLDEAELRHRLEQAGVPRELEERVEAGALSRPEAVAELLEVACEEAGRIAVALGRLVGELLRLGAGEPHRGDEGILELREALGERLRAGPDREHHRQPCSFEPEAAEVVMRRRVLEGGAQRGVADQELGLRLLGVVRLE